MRSAWMRLIGRRPGASAPRAVLLACALCLALPAVTAASPGATAAGAATATAGPPAPLRVSGNGRYLMSGDEPFVWVGDTAWYAVKLDRDEMDAYLADRRERGFNVIQGPILVDREGDFPLAAGDIGALRPSAAGHRPFTSLQPLTPDPDYWQAIDHFVARAGDLGFYVVLPLVWGPELDTLFRSAQQQRAYVDFVTARYGAADHVVWMVAGEWQKVAWRASERDVVTPSAGQLAMVERLGRWVAAGKGANQLVTIHPDAPRSSGRQWHDREWLDFNMIQGYGSLPQSAAETAADWQREPAKPTLQAELCYEDGPACGPGAWYPRMSAYLSAFQGSLGYTYGHDAVWPFRGAADDGADADWRTGLADDGAVQIGGYFRRLMERYHGNDRIPDQSALVAGEGSLERDDFVAVTRDRAGSYLLAYSSRGRAFRLDSRVLAADRVRVRWFDPRTGTFTGMGSQATGADRRYDPPGKPGPGNDYVLVLDDVPELRTAGVPGTSGPRSGTPGG